ncbi:MAG: hypothetical protein A2Y56_11185 [Candidatus Aminicenantes bacterium RBG_13_63_10]|nr:MAG: hypothetical protein A2Y56_11185 [Candidatus Aminicenantes bacterium RBG_13_63_10]
MLGVAVLLAAFIAAGLFFIRPYLTGADQVSYISIAQKYARGEFGQAVNGYWSPLFSWLLAPLLLTGLEPVIAFKVLTLLASAFLLFGVHLLSRRFGLRPIWRLISLAAFAPALFFCFNLIDNGPDILVAGLIACYLFVVFDPGYPKRRYSGLWAGLLGGLAYLAKSYALLFVLGHIVVFHLYLFLTFARGKERKQVVGRALASLAVFVCLSGGWIAAVSLKYRQPMFGSTSRIIWSLVSPTARGPSGHPMMMGGLHPPPNPSAVSAWEDPVLYIALYPDWTPFRSGWDLSFWLRRKVTMNVSDALKVFVGFSPLAPLILSAGLVLAFFPRRHRILFLSWPTLLFYVSGYVALFVIERYLIIGLVLTVLMGAYLIGRLSLARFRAIRTLILILTAAYLAGFFILPIQYSSLFREGRKRFIVTPGFTDAAVYRLGRTLRFRTGIPPGAKIASNGNYSPALFLAYYLGLKYYGPMTPDVSPERNQAELRRSDIDYVFYWSPDRPRDHFLSSTKEITRGKTPFLWVFSLKEAADSHPGPKCP